MSSGNTRRVYHGQERAMSAVMDGLHAILDEFRNLAAVVITGGLLVWLFGWGP